MEQLIELLKQIQDLAGVAIDALGDAKGGEGGDKPEGKPEGDKPDGPPREGGKPPGDGPPPGEGGEPKPDEEKPPPFGRK